MLPKGFRNNIDITPHKIGFPRRQEILDDISDKGTFLPKPVLEEDMDQTFIDFITSDKRLSMTIDGKKVPVIFMTIQRWTEFSKTWDFADKFKDIELPFITIVRHPDIQQGQNQAGLWNIPGDRTYTYMKVPTWDGVRRGIDLYKVPQPTSVDLTYEVRLFTGKMKDLNKFNGKVQRAFQSRQCYINVNGHPMPLHLESIGDESNIDDFENRRFYVQMYEMKLLGYILDADDFQIIPTANRTMLTMEVDARLVTLSRVLFEPTVVGNKINYTFVFRPNSPLEFHYTALYDASVTTVIDIENIDRIIVARNNTVIFDGTIITTPLIINAGDTIRIRVNKYQSTIGRFKLIGNTI